MGRYGLLHLLGGSPWSRSFFHKGVYRVSLHGKPVKRMASSDNGKMEVEDDFDKKDKFMSDVFEMCMKEAVHASRDRSNPVVRFKTPEELHSCMDFKLRSDGVDHSELLDLCSKVFHNSVLTGHPRFFNQQMGGLDTYGLAGNFVTDALATNGHTFEIAPAVSVAEVEVLKHMQKIVGFDGDSTFCPGGTYSNMLSMNLAKTKRFPESKMEGIQGLPRLVSFCSEQAHYSAKKNSALLGFGESNCISIKCDKRGKMIPEELEKRIVEEKEAGSAPFFVTATAGTTVLGSFDPFNEIADICKRQGLWLHVDGAWGMAALLSRKYKHLCDGVERSDSIAWNPHKLMCVPVQCSVLLMKEKGILKRTHSYQVPYLFQEGKPYDESYDLGRDVVQCGRRPDGFRLWLMWKAKGDIGFEKHVNQAFDNAEYLTKAIKNRPNFRIVNPEPEFTNVSFWYVPPSMRGQDENEEFFQKLGRIVPKIKLRMQRSGTLLVGFTPVGDLPPFFRMIVLNELVNHDDMDFVLDEIERNAADL